MTTQSPESGPPAPSGKPNAPKPSKTLVVAGVAAVLLIGILVVVLRFSHSQPSTKPSSEAVLPPLDAQQVASAEGSTVSGASEPAKLVDLQAPAEKLESAFWLDVLQPKAVHRAVMDNAWAKETASRPVGQGFLGPWAVFFGTRGKDIGARFDGLVLDLFTEAMLAEPYRVLWLTGQKSARVPVVVVPEASEVALSTLGTLVAAAGKGGFSPQGCPGEAGESGAEAPLDAGSAKPAEGLATIHRLLLGDHPLFVAQVGKRLIFSVRPDAVVHGMCLEPFRLQAGANAVELGVGLHENGRALQALSTALGLKGEGKLALGLEGTGFVPRGIIGELARPGSLAGDALEDSLLKLVPEGTGVFLTLSLALPAKLDAATLEAVFSGKSIGGPLVKRQVIVLWNPHGDSHLPNEVAVIWSRADDEPSLTPILSKTHPLLNRKLCGHLVLASTEQQLKDISASCSGTSPSVLAAAPAVAKGLKAPSSIGINVNLGRLLSQLVLDGWLSEPRPLPQKDVKAVRIAPPPEIEAARKQLEGLPFLHWRAVVDDKGQLIPGGFRS